MMTAPQVIISEAEWEIMRVVWAHEEVTSREVIDILKDKMDWSESTIKTLIGRLVDKEALETRKDGRKFIYSANISEKETVQSHSMDLLSRVCDKHNVHIVGQLIEEAALSQSDIENLMLQLQEKMLLAPKEVPCHCALGQCVCHLN